ncbi:hypothetical protein M2451_000264 [Dysgonomonas sp. PFB1-18]|uniref:hypothetical protein n=1 Tax=unclassified Dysgonomonas TaxID=2630389 RepID=UPI002473095C|nr:MULTISPECIES: hypothetical protein [unclassified Dysgonomonas]MDH6307815.1 hypothetical protein [Dysgonomonas sp. PF1-14]MDH6337733.1 hypothetical protein [Dysgonomonas sp. PF1-16]MDH6378957.1 hypothetical protein [Dysgonomonas sp. PFB1-18]MDH6396592.1 hypothetical protein [Dysgonomonas sp. PF1-23]
MERLKSILADKILDLSAESGDEVKAKIDKMQRFRDFANALKSLMIKYPAIEDELISMVEDGDFDTKVASSRVDTVIRLADIEAAQASRTITPQIEESKEELLIEEESEVINLPVVEEQQPASVVEEIEDNNITGNIEDTEEPVEEPESAVEHSLDTDDIPMEIYQGEEEPVYHPEDVDYEEVPVSAEEEEEKGYVPYENVRDEDIYTTTESEPDEVTESVIHHNLETEDVDSPEAKTEKLELQSQAEEDENLFPSEEELAAAKRKITIRRVVQVIGIVAAVVALVFIVKFVMLHWQTILIVVGVVLVLAILIYWLVKRKR